MTKSEHIRAKSEHTRRATGEHNRSIQPEQYTSEIAVDFGDDDVKQVWVRFGRLDDKRDLKWGETHEWNQTLDIGPIKFGKRQKKIVAKVSDDQLPASPDCCYYQVLCEIYTAHVNEFDGKHELHSEMLMLNPTLLTNRILESTPSISTTQGEPVQAMSELAG